MKPLVSICCLTYNHEPYIKQCLDGFLMQKTNFPFEILIHDDASADRTQTIIKDYEKRHSDIIKPIFQKENQYSKGVGVTRVYQFPRAKGKYIALCEGDDYWTDSYKLQKQVDFLETHPDFSLSAHKVQIIYDGIPEMKRNSLLRNHPQIIEMNYAILNHAISTPSILFRSELISQIDKHSKWFGGDIPLYLSCLNFGKGYIFDEIMAVKRRNKNSLTQTIHKNLKRELIDLAQVEMYEKLDEQFIYKYHKQFRIKIAYYAFSLGVFYLKQLKIMNSAKCILKSIKNDPFVLFKRSLNRVWYTFYKKKPLFLY